MRIISIFYIWRRDITIFLQNWFSNFQRVLIGPLAYFFIFGVILSPSGLVAENFISIIFPGFLMTTILACGFFGVAINLSVQRTFLKSLEEEMMCPISYRELYLAKLCYGLFQCFLTSSIMILLGLFFLDLNIMNWFALILNLIAISLSSCSWGIIAAVCLSNPRKVTNLGNTLFVILGYLGCTFYSLNIAIELNKYFGYTLLFIPSTYFSELFRMAVNNYNSYLIGTFIILVVIIITILSIIISIKIFEKGIQN